MVQEILNLANNNEFQVPATLLVGKKLYARSEEECG